jgi:uncharacterized protein YeaO (DUF488 family)
MIICEGIPMVKTKRLYDAIGELDGDRILVARHWPRGVSKERLSAQWLMNLAPSKELVRDWKERKISWDKYTCRYHEEMCSQREAIRELANRAMRGTITLLCYEQEDDPCCHRHLLKKLIEREQQKKR